MSSSSSRRIWDPPPPEFRIPPPPPFPGMTFNDCRGGGDKQTDEDFATCDMMTMGDYSSSSDLELTSYTKNGSGGSPSGSSWPLENMTSILSATAAMVVLGICVAVFVLWRRYRSGSRLLYLRSSSSSYFSGFKSTSPSTAVGSTGAGATDLHHRRFDDDSPGFPDGHHHHLHHSLLDPASISTNSFDTTSRRPLMMCEDGGGINYISVSPPRSSTRLYNPAAAAQNAYQFDRTAAPRSQFPVTTTSTTPFFPSDSESRIYEEVNHDRMASLDEDQYPSYAMRGNPQRSSSGSGSGSGSSHLYSRSNTLRLQQQQQQQQHQFSRRSQDSSSIYAHVFDPSTEEEEKEASFSYHRDDHRSHHPSTAFTLHDNRNLWHGGVNRNCNNTINNNNNNNNNGNGNGGGFFSSLFRGRDQQQQSKRSQTLINRPNAPFPQPPPPANNNMNFPFDNNPTAAAVATGQIVMLDNLQSGHASGRNGNMRTLDVPRNNRQQHNQNNYRAKNGQRMPNPDDILPKEAWTDFSGHENWSETLKLRNNAKMLRKKQQHEMEDRQRDHEDGDDEEHLLLLSPQDDEDDDGDETSNEGKRKKFVHQLLPPPPPSSSTATTTAATTPSMSQLPSAMSIATDPSNSPTSSPTTSKCDHQRLKQQQQQPHPITTPPLPTQ